MTETPTAATPPIAAGLDPNAEQVLAALRRRLARKEPDFVDGAVKLCVEMEWIGISADPGNHPAVAAAIVREAEDRLRREPGWLETLDAFVGGEPVPGPPRAESFAGGQPAGQPEMPNCKPMALRYAANGWRVLPLHSVRNGARTCRDGHACVSPGKHPRTKLRTASRTRRPRRRRLPNGSNNGWTPTSASSPGHRRACSPSTSTRVMAAMKAWQSSSGCMAICRIRYPRTPAAGNATSCSGT
jgi:hypothetical protein